MLLYLCTGPLEQNFDVNRTPWQLFKFDACFKRVFLMDDQTRFPHIKAYETKFDLAVKYVKINVLGYYLNKLGRPNAKMLQPKQ